MYKRIIYISLILTAVLATAYYKYGIFTDINYFTALQDINEGKVQILTYGLIVAEHEQIDSIAAKYGFNYNQIKGCVVTNRFINQVDSYNSAVINHLSKVNGLGWEEKFENDVDQLYSSSMENKHAR